MKKILLFISLLLTANSALASVIYYPPPYVNPYGARTYGYPYSTYYQRSVVFPTNIDSCPLQPSYYEPNGNWVPPTRVCPSTNPQVNIHISS